MLDLSKPYTDRLPAALKYAKKVYNRIREERPREHPSFAAEEALQEADEKFHLEMCGVEGDCEMNGEGHFDILYLNTGDTYAATLCYYEGKFIISDWGTIAEEEQRIRDESGREDGHDW